MWTSIFWKAWEV